MKIPDEAIQAAAVALGQHMRIGVVPTSLASAAIEAAMPAIREALAQRIRDYLRINPSGTADDIVALILRGDQ